MAIVARTTTRGVQEAPQVVGTEELRRADTSKAFGSIGAGLTMDIGQDVQDIAEREVKALEERDRVRMMAELSEFEIESVQRVNVLETEGTGDKPFVKGVMDDVGDRAREFINLQPEFLRAETALRLLPIQTKVAKSAVATQQIRIDNENSKHAEIYRNAIVNQVRYNQLGEEIALKQADSFADKLPDTIRDAERARAKEEIRAASLKSKMQSDPEKTLREVEKGKYNDIPSSQLDQIYAAGARSVEATKNKTATLKKKSQELSHKDPAQAALLYWQALDISDPTRDEMMFAQAELGIPVADRSLVTKSRAQEISRQLSAVQSVDEFWLVKKEIEAQIEQTGSDANEIIEDVSKLANVPMALRLVFDANPDTVSQEFLSGAIDLLRNPKAGEDARKQIQSRSSVLGRMHIWDMEDDVSESIADEVEVMMKSGVGIRPGEGTTLEFIQSIEDISAMVYNNADATGEGGAAAVEKMLKARKALKEVRIDDENGYVLPIDLAESFSEKYMNDLKNEMIRRKGTQVSRAYPTEEFGKIEMQTNSGWVMHGNNALLLRSGGMPVFFENDKGQLEPTIVTFKQLSSRKRGRLK